jgi:hypothetical protein
LQRKEHFKKILLHIKELNNRDEDSDESSMKMQNVLQQEKESSKVRPEV